MALVMISICDTPATFMVCSVLKRHHSLADEVVHCAITETICARPGYARGHVGKGVLDPQT
jgi:hypothetical protein